MKLVFHIYKVGVEFMSPSKSVTRLGTMHLTLSCEVHHSRIAQHILDSLRMATSMRYLVTLALVDLFFMVSIA
jgi:hypothetical protein